MTTTEKELIITWLGTITLMTTISRKHFGTSRWPHLSWTTLKTTATSPTPCSSEESKSSACPPPGCCRTQPEHVKESSDGIRKTSLVTFTSHILCSRTLARWIWL